MQFTVKSVKTLSNQQFSNLNEHNDAHKSITLGSSMISNTLHVMAQSVSIPNAEQEDNRRDASR